jgi:hypothetical protein
LFRPSIAVVIADWHCVTASASDPDPAEGREVDGEPVVGVEVVTSVLSVGAADVGATAEDCEEVADEASDPEVLVSEVGSASARKTASFAFRNGWPPEPEPSVVLPVAVEPVVSLTVWVTVVGTVR